MHGICWNVTYLENLISDRSLKKTWFPGEIRVRQGITYLFYTYQKT